MKSRTVGPRLWEPWPCAPRSTVGQRGQDDHHRRRPTRDEGQSADHRNAEGVDDVVNQAGDQVGLTGKTVTGVLTPIIVATSTAGAKIARFSTALAWARRARSAQAGSGLASGFAGSPSALAWPRVAILASM